MKPVRARRHRLPEAAYVGRVCVLFTVCERSRHPHLAQPLLFEMVRKTLTEATATHDCSAPLFCLMPDHLHVIVLGLTDVSRPKSAMDRFKQKSGEWFAVHQPDFGWQHDYHDRIVRRSEGYANAAKYVALNPVRAGLVATGEDWPYVGSIGYDLREIIEDAWW